MTKGEKRIIDLTVDELKEIFSDAVQSKFHQLPPVPTEPEDIVGVDVAMTMTCLARQTIYGLVQHGKIPHIKKPGHKKLYFSRKALQEWLTEGQD